MSLRIAVIGVGHLGKHHARILSSLPGAQLVAVVDTNRSRAAEIASANHAEPLSSPAVTFRCKGLTSMETNPGTSGGNKAPETTPDTKASEKFIIGKPLSSVGRMSHRMSVNWGVL